MQISSSPPTSATASKAGLWGLLLSSVVSNAGNVLTMIALPWFVLTTTGSAVQTGAVGFASFLPGAFSGMLGGGLVDRFGSRRLAIIADVFSGVFILLVPLLYLTVGLAFWQLMLLVILAQVMDLPGLTARRAMLPELSLSAGMKLERSNSFFESSQHLAMLLGPVGAGALIALMGAANVIFINAVTFAISAVAMWLLVPDTAGETRAVRTTKYFRELAEGFQFLRRDSVLLALAIVTGVSNLITTGIGAVLLPVWVKEQFDSATMLGVLLACFGVGSLLGVIVYGAIGHQLPRRRLLLMSALASPIMIWVLVFTTSIPLLVGAIVLGAVFNGPINPMMVTVRQERIPLRMRGRVFGTFSTIAVCTGPLGILASGFLIEHSGVITTAVIIAGSLQLLAFGLLLVAPLKRLDESKGRLVVEAATA